MRKILTILFSLISIVGYSQFPSSPNQGNVNTKNNVLGAMDINKGVVIGYFTDTTAANSATWTSGVPYITITTSDNAIWQRNSTATRWVQISGSGSTSCGVQIGGVVTWDSLLVFSVSASDNYCINNTSYTSAGGTITLDAADPSLPRLDIIGFDTTGAVIKITGTPSSDPQLPQIDANSQYFLTYVLVGAGATTPSNTSQQVVWDENTGSPEWVGSSSGLTVDFDYSANPVNVYHLTKSTNVGAFTNNDIVSYTGDNYSLNTYNSLRFFIKLKSNLNANANISVSLLSNGIPFTSPLVLGVNQGFSKNITSVFQNISIPLSLFAWISDPAQINGVRLTMNGSNANGFYVDYITLQGGIFNGGGNTGNFLEDVYASNDSLYKVKNGIHTFWYKVPSASTDTTVAKFPLYVIQTLGEKDSIGVYGVDSSYQNAIIRSDSLVLHRFNGDSTVLPVGGSYIPLSGTTVGNPVTGDVEFDGGQLKINGGGYYTIETQNDGGAGVLKISDGVATMDVTPNVISSLDASLQFTGGRIVVSSNELGLWGSGYFPGKDIYTYTQKHDIDLYADSIRQELADSMATVGSSGITSLDTTNLHGRGVAYYQLEGDSAVLVLQDSTRYAVAAGSGSGAEKYITAGYGITVDSSVANVYEVGVDTATVLEITNPRPAYHIFGNNTGSSASPTWGKLNVNSINATGTPSSSTVLKGDGSWGTNYATQILKGGYAQRPSIPDSGTIYYQTDRLIGQYVYDGRRWGFCAIPEKIVFNESYNNKSDVPRFASGTGAGTTVIDTVGNSGFVRVSAGTTSTGYAAVLIQYTSSPYTFATDSVIRWMAFRVRVPVLSDATDRFAIQLGANSHQWANLGNLINFRYTDNINSGKWQTFSKAGTAAGTTTKDTGIPVVAGVWYDMAILINGYSKTIEYYIDNTLVATHSGSDNMPFNNGIVTNVQYAYSILKSAGTTARVFDVDNYFHYIIKQEYE